MPTVKCARVVGATTMSYPSCFLSVSLRFLLRYLSFFFAPRNVKDGTYPSNKGRRIPSPYPGGLSLLSRGRPVREYSTSVFRRSLRNLLSRRRFN